MLNFFISLFCDQTDEPETLPLTDWARVGAQILEAVQEAREQGKQITGG